MQFFCKQSAFLLFTLALLAPSDGVAQTVKNELGIYTSLSAEPSSASIDIGVGIPFDVYLIVINPGNENYKPEDCGENIVRPINFIPAIQYALVKPESGMYIIGELPNGPLAGRGVFGDDNIWLMDEPFAVPENRITLLLTYTLMVVDLDPKFLFLQPTTNQPTNGILIVDEEERFRPGCDNRNDLQDLYPSSGDPSLPVFGINATVVATDARSWGDVKALYR